MLIPTVLRQTQGPKASLRSILSMVPDWFLMMLEINVVNHVHLLLEVLILGRPKGAAIHVAVQQSWQRAW